MPAIIDSALIFGIAQDVGYIEKGRSSHLCQGIVPEQVTHDSRQTLF